MFQIKLTNVDINYGQNNIVNNVSFSIQEGELVSIIGPNGSGKSTLLKAILGIQEISKGSILINGLSPKKAISKYKGSLAYLPQQHNVNLLLPLTVFDVVSQAFQFKKISALTHTEKNSIVEALEKVNLSDKQHELFMNLSGGQRQRVLLALALAHKPKLLLLDEPTNTLDVVSINHIYDILAELKNSGVGILMISHDISSIVSHSDKIGVLMHQLHYFGSPYLLPENIIHQVFGAHIKIIPNDPSCKECNIYER